MKRLKVFLNFKEESEIPVGELAERDHKIYFQYAPEFLDKSLWLSPYKLPLSPDLYEHKDIAFVDPFHSEIGLGEIIYPGWNYYNAPDVISPSEQLKFFLGLTKFDQKRIKPEKRFGTLDE